LAVSVDQRAALIKKAKQIFLVLFLITKQQEKTQTELEEDQVKLLTDLSVDMCGMMREQGVFTQVQKQPIELWHELFARGHYMTKKTFAKCAAFVAFIWFLYQRYGLFRHQAGRVRLLKDLFMLAQKGKDTALHLKTQLKY